jgi:hypothetical protein
MSVLVIDDAAIRKVREVLEYAEAHPYRPGDKTPGDAVGHVAFLNRYRVVFTFTHVEGIVFRHITISMPERGKFPHPIAAFTIAVVFGFTGWSTEMGEQAPKDWRIGINELDNCITIVQPMRSDVAKSEIN